MDDFPLDFGLDPPTVPKAETHAPKAAKGTIVMGSLLGLTGLVAIAALIIALVLALVPSAATADKTFSSVQAASTDPVLHDTSQTAPGRFRLPGDEPTDPEAKGIEIPFVVDGVRIEVGDEVLLKDEVDPLLNGVYQYDEFRTLVRTDKAAANRSSGTFSNFSVFVREGSTYKNSVFVTQLGSTTTNDLRFKLQGRLADESGGSIGPVEPLTFSASGNGANPGSNYDTTASTTISYNTIGAAPFSHTHTTNQITGVFDPLQLGTGTAITTKFLRGDGTWVNLPSSGIASTATFAATSGNPPGTQFDGTSDVTISFNTVGAAPAGHTHTGADITSGSITGLTSISATNLSGTLQTPSQPNVTSLSGVTSLNNITVGSGTLSGLSSVSATAVSATNLTGTLQTASQPNVTSLPGVTSLNGITVGSGTLNGVTSINGSPVGTANLPLLNAFGSTNGADTSDIGFYGLYTSGGTRYSALFRDASDAGRWKILNGLTVAPAGNVVDLTSGTAGELVLGTLTATSLAGTLTTASQPNVTTLSSVTSLNGITVASGTLSGLTSVSSTSVTATNLTGTLQTASQPNVTTLSSVTSLNGITVGSGTLSGLSSVSATNLTGTLQTASQPNVTTLSSVTSLNGITVGSGTLSGLSSVSSTAVSATNVTGTLQTAAQPNITSLSAVTSLNGITVGSGTLSNVSTVNGVAIGTPLYQHNTTNAADLLDIGFYGLYTSGGTRYSALFRDASDSGRWKILNGLTVAPSGNVVDLTSGVAGELVLGTLTANNVAGTLTTASQPNVTTLSSVTSLNGITVGSGTLSGLTSVSSTAVSATNLTGTLQTASQPNVTTLAGVTSLNGITVGSGTLSGLTSVSSTAVTATNLTGTLQTASQPNVTTLAGVTSLNGITVGSGTLSGVTSINGSPVGTVSLPLLNAFGSTNAADASDIGFYGIYTSGGTRYSALFRDASDAGRWKILNGLTVAPSGNVVDLTSGVAGELVVGTLSATSVAGTLTTASQPNVTTLLSVTSLNGITVGSGTLSGLSSVSATNLTGTLQTASQPNVTTLAGVTSLNGITVGSGTLSGLTSLSSTAVSATNLTGTLQTASQPNVTTLAGVTSLNGITVGSGTLSGLTTVNGVAIGTPLSQHNTTNAADLLDIGFYGLYTSGGARYSAFFRDASDAGRWKILNGLTVAPSGNVVDLTSGVAGELVVGTLTATTVAGTLSTASQPNVTTLGGVTSLNGITVGSGTLSGLSSVSSTNLTGTLQTASQPNVTTLAGVTSLNNITVGAGTLSGLSSVSSTNLTGTLQTASQPNVTTLAGVTSLNNITVSSGTLSNVTSVNGVAIGTPLYQHNTTNAADLLDIGFYGLYTSGATRYSAFFRDASDSGRWKILNGLTVAPSGNVVDLTSGVAGELVVGTLTATTVAGTLSTASQPNVTTLSSVTSLNGITVGAGTLSGLSSVSSTNLTGTLQTASQPNVTTLSSVTSLNGITVGSGTLSGLSSVSSTAVSATNLTGTLQTASQPNVTTLSGVTSLNGITVGSGTLSGLTTVNGVAIGTPLSQHNTTNAADLLDIGFYGLYTSGGTRYSAFFRDASDAGRWKILNGLTVAPSGNVVDLTSGVAGELVVGTLSATSVAGTLSTASQPNVTTLSSVTSLNGITVGSGTLSGLSSVSSTNLTGTLQTASQPNITTLAGVTSLNSITVGSSTLSGLSSVSSTNLTGTLQTASQPNITTLAGVTSLNGITVGSGTLSGVTTINGSPVGSASLALLNPFGTSNAADLQDIGFYGIYTSGGTRYSALFRDASDSGRWKILNGLTVAPSGNVMDLTSGVAGELVVGTLTADKVMIRSNTSAKPTLQYAAIASDVVMGIDNSDGRRFKLTRNTQLDLNPVITMDPNYTTIESVVSTLTVTTPTISNFGGVCWSPELRLFCAVSTNGLSDCVATSRDGVNWTTRTGFTTSFWRSVCWSSNLNLFCAVGSPSAGGTTQAMTSPDGITWTQRTTPGSYDWGAVCWSPELSLFCAVAYGGVTNSSRVMTSPNGAVWTIQACTVDQLRSVCWSPELGLFCAVGAIATTNSIVTSPDGTTWTTQTSPNSLRWFSVAWSSALLLFCAVSIDGTNNQVITSPDGVNWTSRTTPGAANRSWQSLVWARELRVFWAVSNSNDMMTSYDGIQWTPWTPPTGLWRRTCWSPDLGIFLTVSGSASGNQAFTSASMFANAPSVSVSGRLNVQSVNSTADSIVRYSSTRSDITTGVDISDSYRYKISRSTEVDLQTVLALEPNYASFTSAWTGRNGGSLSYTFQKVCWSPELRLFCTVAADATTASIATSPDGITWTARTAAANGPWRSVCWSSTLGLFCAVGESSGAGSQAMTSSNGTAWTVRTTPNSATWLSVCWSPQLSLFCAVASVATPSTSLIMTSPDGIAWTARTSPSSNGLYSVVWSPALNLFCAVGDVGTIITSSNGVIWSAQSGPNTNNWRGLEWSPELGMFCAFWQASAGVAMFMTSLDGIRWVMQTFFRGGSSTPNTIVWSREFGIFCVLGDFSVTLYSSDGINWVESGSFNLRKGICWSPELGLFVSVGTSSTVANRLATSNSRFDNTANVLLNSTLAVTGYTGINIGSGSLLYPLHIDSSNANVSATPTAGVMLQSSSAGTARYVIRTAGGTPVFASYNHGGTLASPTTTLAGTVLGYFLGGGYDGSGVYALGSGMLCGSEGDWTSSSSRPSYLFFETTPSSSGSRSERMRISANGNVGIGTSSPTTLLHASAPVGTAEVIRAHRQANSANFGSGIAFALNNAAGTTVDYGSIYGTVITATAGSHTGGLAFFTATAGALTQKMAIDSSGNVGIATTPVSTYKTIIQGGLVMGDAATSDTTAYAQLQIVRPSAQGTGFHQTFIRQGSNVVGTGFLSSSNTFGIQVGLDNTGSTGIFMTNIGQIGIGDRAPNNRLEVAGGGLRVQGAISGTASGAGVEIEYSGGVGQIRAFDRGAGTWQPLQFGGSVITFLTGGGSRASFDSSGHFVPSFHNTFDLGTTGLRWKNLWLQSGAFNGSDRRLKREIRRSRFGLDFIRMLEPVSWQWKDGSDTALHYGFIAQQVKEVLTDLGASNQDFAGYHDPADTNQNGSLALSYTQFIAPVVAAIQEIDRRATPTEGAPKNQTSPGSPGEQRFTDDHLYVCVKPNVWKRIAWDSAF